MKKCFILVLTLALIICLAPAALAATADATAAANTLHELGLFMGTGIAADGTPKFDLDRAPTRAEAVTMLVRLLGKEEEATAGSWTTPFTDVATWAQPYVGYAYAHKLTTGTSATKFSGNSKVTATQYLTLVLRALGYDDSQGDFSWDKAWQLSDTIGFTAGTYTADYAFMRGDVACVSYNALSAPLKGSQTTLYASLKNSGAIAADANATLRPLTPTTSQPAIPANLSFTTLDNSQYYFSNQPPLTDFTLQKVEYAQDGQDVYFRVTYDSSTVINFLVVPYQTGPNDMGDMTKYAVTSKGKGNTFTCKVPLSWFKTYAALDISPNEDGHSGPDILIGAAAFLTADGSALRFRSVPASLITDDSYEVADFAFKKAEYAETIGGRVYRISFTNSERRNIQFWTRYDEQSEGWNTDLLQVVWLDAGATTASYFVPERNVNTYDFIYVRVRDAEKINPSGGNHQEHSGISIRFFEKEEAAEQQTNQGRADGE